MKTLRPVLLLLLGLEQLEERIDDLDPVAAVPMRIALSAVAVVPVAVVVLPRVVDMPDARPVAREVGHRQDDQHQGHAVADRMVHPAEENGPPAMAVQKVELPERMRPVEGL